MEKPSSLKFRATLMQAPDNTDDCYICIPDVVMERMDWSIGDTLELQPHPNGTVSISKCETTIDADVLVRAREIFDTQEQASRWLNNYHSVLGKSPAEYLNNGGSKQEIFKILSAICYGGPV